MDDLIVGLGGNRGDVRRRFTRALDALRALPDVAAVRVSHLYATAPVGRIRSQPEFINGAVRLRFRRGAEPTPRELMGRLLDLERRLGRRREAEVPGGPRFIDLDWLVWGARILDDAGPPRVVLPHPRLGGRAFALAPLRDLVGRRWVIPGPRGGPVGDLLDAALRDPAQAIRRIV